MMHGKQMCLIHTLIINHLVPDILSTAAVFHKNVFQKEYFIARGAACVNKALAAWHQGVISFVCCL